MSRHHVDATNGLQADLGWDRPLGTFFVQVYESSPEEDMVLWAGFGRGEIATVEDLAELIAPHGIELDPALRHALAADREHEGFRPSGPATALDFFLHQASPER